MSVDHYRRIGALVGLSAGFGLMALLGYSGMVAAAIFGVAGCVAGAIAAEKLFARKQEKDR